MHCNTCTTGTAGLAPTGARWLGFPGTLDRGIRALLIPVDTLVCRFLSPSRARANLSV